MKENSVEMRQAGIEVPAAEPEPTAEVLGGIKELAQRKHYFNEGPGRLDI